MPDARHKLCAGCSIAFSKRVLAGPSTSTQIRSLHAKAICRTLFDPADKKPRHILSQRAHVSANNDC
ncbi:hypothetical protein SPHINGO361_150148 [Sphingomonas sp. EC-HK361]|nr:hypothetical protein SPHINGO361_150148 [Sphingomonas sp. EC-HK361]